MNVRSLFFKIFAFFWLCTALIVGAFIATAERPTDDQIRAAVHRGLTPAILSNGETLIRAYESGGCQAMKTSDKSNDPGRIPLTLVDLDGDVLCDTKHRKLNVQPVPAAGTVDFRTIDKRRMGVSGVLQGKSASYLAVLELRPIDFPLGRG